MSDMAYKGIPTRSAAGCLAVLALATPQTVAALPSTPVVGMVVTGGARLEIPRTHEWDQFIAWSSLRGRVLGWGSLPVGWDGDGAEPPTAATVEAALTFMQKARDARVPLPQPFIASDGEIGFRWARGNAFASVSFLDDGSVVGTIRDGAGNRTDIDQATGDEFPAEALSSLIHLG